MRRRSYHGYGYHGGSYFMSSTFFLLILCGLAACLLYGRNSEPDVIMVPQQVAQGYAVDQNGQIIRDQQGRPMMAQQGGTNVVVVDGGCARPAQTHISTARARACLWPPATTARERVRTRACAERRSGLSLLVSRGALNRRLRRLRRRRRLCGRHWLCRRHADW